MAGFIRIVMSRFRSGPSEIGQGSTFWRSGVCVCVCVCVRACV